MKPKIIISINTAWNVINFRRGLIKSLIGYGYEVIVVTPTDDYSVRISTLGCRYISLKMHNKGLNPFQDIALFWRFYKLFRHERPCAYLSFTIKPNIYGSMAAHVLKIPVINNITGLGSVFIKDSWLKYLVNTLYYLALCKSSTIFFQNEDDKRLFIKNKLVKANLAERLPGSGVDLVRFNNHNNLSVRHYPEGDRFRFLLAARLLWDKGILEYVEAAKILHKRLLNVEFCLLGFLDVENPQAIKQAEVNKWVKEGIINYLGVSDTIEREIAKAHCVVLPSYREGLPRILLEAAAMACPIITTDAIGCRDIVEDNITGLLCQPRNALDLANKMEKMINLSHSERLEMGRQGRKKIELAFDEQIVIKQYINALKKVV